VTTNTTPVVCHKTSGIYYYSPSVSKWFPVGLDAQTEGAVYQLAAGADIVLASTDTKVGYLHHGEFKDDGTMDFHVCKTWWDFTEIAPGTTNIAAMDVSDQRVSILVQTFPVEVDDGNCKIGATDHLEAAKAAEEEDVYDPFHENRFPYDSVIRG
jgi:hypothetical protein